MPWLGRRHPKKQKPSVNSRHQSVTAIEVLSKLFKALELPDGDLVIGEYLITKLTTTVEVLGADFVAVLEGEEKGSFSMVFGDIVGHGLSYSPGAILAMSTFKGRDAHDPKIIQMAMNKILFLLKPDMGNRAFCLAAHFGPGGAVEYCGRVEHLSILKSKGKTFKPKILDTHGEILGVTHKLKYTKKTELQMNYGDVLIIRTDGHLYNDLEDDKTLVMVTRIEKKQKRINS